MRLGFVRASVLGSSARLLRRMAHSLVGLVLGAGFLGVATFASGLDRSFESGSDRLSIVAGPAALRTATPSPASTVAVAAAAAAATTSPTEEPTLSPTATPTAAPTPSVLVAAYRNGGRLYSGVSAPVGATFLAERPGTVSVRTYQLVDGEVRVGSNIPGQLFFPYIAVRFANGETLTYRPGALNVDTQLVARDGEVVAKDAPLFRLVGAGASSWRTFYDRNASFNVVVSLVAANNTDRDAAPLIVTR